MWTENQRSLFGWVNLGMSWAQRHQPHTANEHGAVAFHGQHALVGFDGVGTQVTKVVKHRRQQIHLPQLAQTYVNAMIATTKSIC